MQQIPVPKTLDVEVVEEHLSALWQENAAQEEDAALLRARVANLIVFVSTRGLLPELEDSMLGVTSTHPGRVLVMLAENDAPDQDIEMRVKALCQSDKRTGAKRLCGEVVVLNAQGKFTVELPSAGLPLLVSDLTTFLWWRNEFSISDKIFGSLLAASDRLVIDSDEFGSPLRDLREVDALFAEDAYKHAGVSDLNWARLTFWRGLLADFYDVPAYRPLLDKVDHVQIDYTAPANDQHTIAPQALLFAGWLSSCLGWTLKSSENKTSGDHQSTFTFSRGADSQAVITLELNRVETGDRKAGRLAQVQLRSTTKKQAVFLVKRSDDNHHILAEANVGADTQRGRVLPVRNRSLAQLLSREMEILVNDNLYQQSLAVAVNLIDQAS